MPHKLITDLQYGTIVSSGRKSVTLKASDPYDPVFLLRRVIRSPYERLIKEGLLSGSSLPLSTSDFNTLHEKKSLITENLCSWPPQFPLSKFSILRNQNFFILSAIDVRSTDSYLLKTRSWPQIRTAVLDLTNGVVKLSSPALLELYNPFAAYAPFTTPSQSDFERANNKIIAEIEEQIKTLSSRKSCGYMQGKVGAQYYKVIAELQALGEAMTLVCTPSGSDFELENLEK